MSVAYDHFTIFARNLFQKYGKREKEIDTFWFIVDD